MRKVDVGGSIFVTDDDSGQRYMVYVGELGAYRYPSAVIAEARRLSPDGKLIYLSHRHRCRKYLNEWGRNRDEAERNKIKEIGK